MTNHLGRHTLLLVQRGLRVGSLFNFASGDITREKGPKRIGPYMVPRCMSSTVSAGIATFFKIKGLQTP